MGLALLVVLLLAVALVLGLLSLKRTQGILLFALILAALTVIYYEARWLVELKREVDRTTADLRRSREQYRSVVENAPDFILLVDGQGDLISANNAAARAFGVPPEEIPGRALDRFLAPEDAQALMLKVQEVVNRGQSAEATATVRLKDRDYRVSAHFVPLFGEDGRTVERVLVLARDITGRRQLEEQMFQTQKLASLGTLAAGVAHEINNPLSVILGFTEILLDRLPADGKEHEILKTIERQVLNAKRIVEKLMTYARQRAEYGEFTDINQDISNILLLVQNTLLTGKIDLELQLAADLPRVRGDSGELQQVVFNLVNNAVAAMPQGGKLTVATRLNPETLMVEAIFADSGAGIPKDIAEHIFDPFFTTKRAGEGTGLGLSVSYAIISKYGGNIRFESRLAEAGGGEHGTTFYVSLPPEAPAQGPGVPPTD